MKRMFRAAGIFVAVAICFLALAPATRVEAQNGAALPAAWTHWKYSRAIDLPATASERLVSLAVPPEIYARTSNRLADLRVMDDTGGETSYVLSAQFGDTETQPVPSQQRELSYGAEHDTPYTMVVVDAGAQAPFHNAARVVILGGDFIAWADVAVSDDARHWRETGALTPIYRFSARNISGEQTISYPPTNARYLRLRIYHSDPAHPNARLVVSHVELLHQVKLPDQMQSAGAPMAEEASKDATKSVWRADLGAKMPVRSVEVHATNGEFYRSAAVYSSDDGENWDECGAGTIHRFHASPPEGLEAGEAATRAETSTHEQLIVKFPETWARYFRVEITNGNDAPLMGAKIRLLMATRKIIFRQAPGRKYSLLYGQSEAHAPQYDLAQTVTPERLLAAAPATGLAPEVVNIAWTDPRPWTETHSIVLWIAVILAALLLGFVAIRSLRNPGTSQG